MKLYVFVIETLLMTHAACATITVVHENTGLEMCKAKCLLHNFCEAVAYDVSNLVCQVIVAGSVSSLDQPGIIIPAKNFEGVSRGICRSIQCTKEWHICTVTRATKVVCTEQVSLSCMHVPRFRNTDRVLTVRGNDVLAKFTCHANYSFNPGAVKELRCDKNGIWEMWVDCSILIRVLNGRKTKLPVPMTANRIIILTGRTKAARSNFVLYQGSRRMLQIRITSVNTKIKRTVVTVTPSRSSKKENLKMDRVVFTQDKFVSLVVKRTKLVYKVQLAELRYSVHDFDPHRDPMFVSAGNWRIRRMLIK